MITGDLVRLANGPGSPGGIFYTDVLGRGTTRDFDTFCVELTENISFGTTYYVQGVGLSTNQGGKALGAQAAWLYTQFTDMNATKLTGFNFVSPTTNQANAIQLGIWSGMAVPYSQATIQSLSGWSSSYINTTLTPLLTPWLTNFNSDVTNNLWSGTGQVQIMNLRGFSYSTTGAIMLPDGRRITLTSYAQDQLIRVTPELPSLSSACTVVGCALVWGIVSLRRKRALAFCAA